MSHYLSLAYLLLLWSTQKVQSGVKFTNLVCGVLDKDFVYFPYCYIKAVNRTYQYASVKVGLLKRPVTNLSVTVAIKKKANGYRPFLYNYTINACKFLKGAIGNPVLKLAYKIVASYTNLNHTCPYDHDIFAHNVSSYHVNYLFTNLLPAPRGEYGLYVTWYAYNVPRLFINGFAELF